MLYIGVGGQGGLRASDLAGVLPGQQDRPVPSARHQLHQRPRDLVPRARARRAIQDDQHLHMQGLRRNRPVNSINKPECVCVSRVCVSVFPFSH